MHFLPWWALVACLAASPLAAYLLIGRTQAGGSRWALFALTAAAAAPVLLAGAMVVAIVLSTLLSAYPEDRNGAPAGQPEPAARTERSTGGEATTETTEGTEFRTTPELAAPAAGSPSASPGASPTASSSASASP